MQTIIEATGHRHVEFPREITISAVANQFLRQSGNQWTGVQHFIRAEARHRAGHNVAHIIHARLHRCQGDVFHSAKDDGHVFDADLAELDLLARRQIEDAVAVRRGDVSQRAKLRGGRPPAGHPYADHKKSRRRLPQEKSVPFQALHIIIGDRFPTGPRILGNGVPDV
jgi:hypothetical protein